MGEVRRVTEIPNFPKLIIQWWSTYNGFFEGAINWWSTAMPATVIAITAEISFLWVSTPGRWNSFLVISRQKSSPASLADEARAVTLVVTPLCDDGGTVGVCISAGTPPNHLDFCLRHIIFVWLTDRSPESSWWFSDISVGFHEGRWSWSDSVYWLNSAHYAPVPSGNSLQRSPGRPSDSSSVTLRFSRGQLQGLHHLAIMMRVKGGVSQENDVVTMIERSSWLWSWSIVNHLGYSNCCT